MLNVTYCELRRILLKALASYYESLFYQNELVRNHERATEKSRRLEELWRKYHEQAVIYCDSLAILTCKGKGHFLDIIANAISEADPYDPDWMREFCENVPYAIFDR